jgi:glycosyltransferase involved in cell wall biosynthesis
VLNEAQCHCVPIVATALRGVPETVEDGGTARLVQSRDLAALTDAVIDTLGSPRGTAGSNERRRDLVAARFSTEAMIAARLRLSAGTAAAASESLAEQAATC